jgi:hypothetical protein
MTPTKKPKETALAKEVGKALRKAAKQARKIARMYKTPIYVERNGKVVALKP